MPARSHMSWKRSIASSTVQPLARRMHFRREVCGEPAWISSAIWWMIAVEGFPQGGEGAVTDRRGELDR